jgi:hypothetical protein
LVDLEDASIEAYLGIAVEVPRIDGDETVVAFSVLFELAGIRAKVE